MSKTATHFQMAKHIRHLLLTCFAECTQYEMWSDDFRLKQIGARTDKILNSDWFQPIDCSKLTIEQMEVLGFGIWTEESDRSRLVPFWMHPFLSENFPTVSINGDEVPASKTDNDHRMGFLAYEVTAAEEEEMQDES